jgi:hypothetical protein
MMNWKGFEREGGGIIEMLSRNLLEGTKEIHEGLQS